MACFDPTNQMQLKGIVGAFGLPLLDLSGIRERKDNYLRAERGIPWFKAS